MSTTKKQIGYGSQGNEVKELQTTLNNYGYNLDEDGIFGSKTLSAVKDYQTKNNLSVDGIVGKNTWGSLLSSGSNTTSTTAPKTDTTATTSKTSAGTIKTTADGYTYNDYSEGDSVKSAFAYLESLKQQKPGEYKSQWQQGLDEAMKKILNREKFSYDLNGDALYQQYKDQYKNQGKMAMQDTMGQAAAMTGGYGSSYGQSVGQQTYQGYMQQLTDKIPELYQLALDQYNREGEELYNEYGLYADRENQDYGRYRDKVADYNTDLDRAENRYYTERDYDYGKYVDNRDFGYGAHRNEIADDQWQTTFDEGVRQYNEQFEYQKDRDKVTDAQWNEEFTFAKQQYEDAKKSDGGGSGGSGGSGGGSNTAALEHVATMSSAEIVETMQGYQADEDNTGLSAFLSDCVASGRMTQEQADSYYAQYRTGNTETDKTIIPPQSSGMGTFWNTVN